MDLDQRGISHRVRIGHMAQAGGNKGYRSNNRTRRPTVTLAGLTSLAWPSRGFACSRGAAPPDRFDDMDDVGFLVER